MAMGATTFFNLTKGWIADGTFDLDGSTFKAAIVTSSWTPNQTTDDLWGDISANEASATNGYTAGGVTLTGVTWTGSSGTWTFDSNDPSWTATGAGITGKYLVVYASGTLNGHLNPLLFYKLLESGGSNVTFPAGTTNLVINASGYFTLA